MKRTRKIHTSNWQVIFTVVILVGAMMSLFTMCTEISEDSIKVSTLNNCKQLVTACALFAADKGGGAYPEGNLQSDGNYPERFSFEDPHAVAETCLQDLIYAGIVEPEIEHIFWTPNMRQCSEEKPDKDGVLKAGENGWDYVSGLNHTNGNHPLIFEASDTGKAIHWTRDGGHHSKDSVVIGFGDGSSTSVSSLAPDGTLDPSNDFSIKPRPGDDPWPENVVLAPATPVSGN